MTDHIYIIDPSTKQPAIIQPVSFSDIGIRERYDLQPWIIEHPQMLGEELLTITSEFDRFDKSNSRLDILAMDKKGVLVIIELKLDASRTLADLQAIRYAAFCSNMTAEDILREYVNFHKCDQDAAAEAICTFTGQDELSEPENQPRIILAAGSLNDQELTSSVLWLRKFGLDISCVELTPFRNETSGEVIIVPRVLIPLPEAKKYLIGVERKEERKVWQARETSDLEKVGNAIAAEFEKLDTGFQLSSGRMRSGYMTVRLYHSWIHYEWLCQRRKGVLEVALHFEYPDRDENLRLLKVIDDGKEEIIKNVSYDFFAGDFGKRWTAAGFVIELENGILTPAVAPEAAKLMQTLIDRTWPIIEPYIKRKDS